MALHFREQLSIEQYARRLGVTTVHLNSMTRRYAGQSAQVLVHKRQLLEARHLTGQTPSAFRQQR